MEDYSEIGALFRRARTDRRIDIATASQALHIRPRYIEAIEEGRLSDLPGPPYSRGYLLSYTQYLDLDKNEILRRFDMLEEAQTKKSFYFPQELRSEKAPSKNMMWGGLAAAMILYCLWILIFSPSSATLTPEEAAPPVPADTHQTARLTGDVSCFKPDGVIYPPCSLSRMHTPESVLPGTLPLRTKFPTIMDLGTVDEDDEDQDDDTDKTKTSDD